MTTNVTDGQALPAVLDGFDLTDQSRFAEGVPYELFARLRTQAPVLFHPPGPGTDGEGFWVITTHADVTAVAADPAFSAEGGGGRKGGGSHLEDLPVGVYAGVLLPMMDDPRHDLIKRLLGPAVTGPALAALRSGLRADAESLVDAALDGGTVDFATEVSGPFAVHSVALLLGAPRTDRDQLVAWTQNVVGFADRRTGEHDERSRNTTAGLTAYARDLLAAKRRSPADDLATVLATGDLPGEAPLTDLERESNLALLLLTGAEQPRNTLAEGVLAFARRPEVWHALRADRSLLPLAVEEVLRWGPPNPYNRRTATRDVRLRDIRISAGEKVTLWWPSANRDEVVFPRADTFDIRRSPNPHVTFGHGNHYCLGVDMARLEIRVLLETLLDRVREISVAGPVTRAPNNKHTVLLDLPIALTR